MPTENSLIEMTQSQESDAEYIWTDSIERILDKMRINCVNLSEYHMFKYRRYKRYLMFFRIPIIILSGINVFTAIGLQSYVSQSSISIINSIISLACGMITSIELFLNIQKKMETDLVSHKDYYRLSIDIFKVISLERNIRKVDGKTFLDQKFSEYEKLIKSSNVFDSEYVFDTISSQVPIIPSITHFINDKDKDKHEHNMLKTIGKTMCNLPNYLVPHSNQRKREAYIKTHRDATRAYFYKDVEILARMETEKTKDLSEKKQQMNKQKILMSEAAMKAAAKAVASLRQSSSSSSLASSLAPSQDIIPSPSSKQISLPLPPTPSAEQSIPEKEETLIQAKTLIQEENVSLAVAENV